MSTRISRKTTRRWAMRSALCLNLTALAVFTVLSAGYPVQALAQEAATQINLPAQSLDDSLIQLGRQTSLQFFYTPDTVAGVQAPRVQGRMTPEEALKRLLEGTSVEYRREGRNVTLSRLLSTTQLGAVKVVGGRGDLPPAYAGGQVATGGRVGLLGTKDVMETPFNTISYTDAFIQDIQAQDLGRVISLTDPSVYKNGATGMISDNFSIRGFSISGGDVAFGGLYGLIPYYRVTPELAERIEVLKGPSALLNGMPPGGSVGGSINIVPKHAGEEPLARVTGTYMSDAQFGTHVDVGRRFGDDNQFGIRFNGVYRDGDSPVDNQTQSSKLASLGLDWRSDRVRLSADMYTNEDHVDGLNRGVSLAPGIDVPRPPDPDVLLAPDWTFSNTKDRAVILRGEVDITRDITAYAAWGKSKTDFDSLASSTYTIFNDAGDYRNNFAHQRSIFDRDSAEIGLRSRFRTGSVGHELAVTATYYKHTNQFGFLRNMMAEDWVTNIYDPAWGPTVGAGFSSEPLPKTGAVRSNSYGVADTLSFAEDRVQLTLGVRRQTVVSDTFDAASGDRTARYDAGATTPAVALLVKANDSLSIYGNYIEGLSQGATAPATAENAGEVFPPYKTKQREIGLKMDFGRFAGVLSAFQIARPNAYTDPVSNVYSFGGEQRNRGVELSFYGEAAKGLRLMGGIAYTQAKLTKTAGGVDQGKLATAVPAWQAKLGAEWDVPAVQGLTLTGNMVSMSKQYINADNSLSVPGRTVFDLGARYMTSIADHPLTLRATVQNLTNKAYWAGSLASGTGAPRTFLLSASLEY
ncbi:TonB-dependent receptor [Pusillimonas sp. SM2304]|uniref:TonB-dependent receptor n=1 Tax=Pusillimonas sp. SM2304 TaxID=3073241 RepID=UPI002876E312|nr:TonB-dependent receptor [Pusillimonas sp. SM2304]MDS1139418.1 TonB-dependent receptor [Pusillimonas sp. SM2304]